LDQKICPRKPKTWNILEFQLGREELESKGAQFHLTTKTFEICQSIRTTGEVELNNPYEKIDSDLLVKTTGEYTPDPMMDDVSLIIQTERGLVVVAGCAHRGIINTLQHAQKMTGDLRILNVIGGFHLYQASQERLDWTIQTLKAMDVKKVSPCHCTGFNAMVQIYQNRPDIINRFTPDQFLKLKLSLEPNEYC
jgi:7,8-dihydropterin-6-yl-methyl-4-(beta-D-ribofuranosyl)aminobenzene 5'-phosphate synthase